ncbi:MAG TPA: hypothetical protein VD731_02990 [Nitrosopumilaceae archaeon]|nr:hypothetical protein [Nitrosopumilaceae archaeon]
MKGNKISSFFLILVLLLSVTNLPTFSTSQLDSDSHNLYGLSIGLIDVAFADDDDDEEEDDDNEKDKKEKKDKEEKKEQKSGKQKIKVEIEDGKSEIEIKIDGIESELKLESTDMDDILSAIQSITGLSESEIKDIWEIKIEDDDEDEDDHGKKDKITICHIPPGNPSNAHTISVSGNAKNAHLAHGDTLGECPDSDDQDDDDPINPTTITLTKQVTNDNQGTAGPNDFKISVNGTIVLSGSTTNVAPNVLFAINETVADGYEFVQITGDPKCPTNLDEKTISLAPGEDISCVIHNNDVSQASSSFVQTGESLSETATDNNELSQLIEENKKLREDLERQEEQIDELNEQVDYLSEIIASIQGFLDRIFG